MTIVEPAALPQKYAYSYVRFSHPDQIMGDSIRRHTSIAADYAAENGLVLDDRLTYRDMGVSSFRGQNAAYGKLGDFLAAVSSGFVPSGSVLLVENLDRLSRDHALNAQNLLTQIVLSGISIVTLSDRRTYSIEELRKDPMGLIYALINFIRANEESELKSFRSRACWTAKRGLASKTPMTAKCPGWLKLNPKSKRFTIIPDRGRTVRRIFRLTLEGRSAAEVAAVLNSTKTLPWTGSVRWNRHNVGMISGFSAAIGTLVPHADDWTTGSRVTRAFAPVPNYYPAVVSVADFELAQAQTLRTKGGHGSVDHLVRQLAICGCCGAPMRGLRRGQAEFSSVVCSAAIMGIGCTYHQIEFAPLERTLKLRLPLELFSHMDDDIVIVQSNILNKAQNEVDRARRTWSEATSQDSDDNHLTVQSGALWEEVVASENHLLDTVEGYQQKRTKKMRVRIAIALELLALPVWTTNETARLNKLLRLLFKAIVVHPHGGGMDLVFLDGRQQHLAIA